MKSRRAAAVTGLGLVAVAAATHSDWVTAICLYGAARTLGPLIPTPQQGTSTEGQER